MRLPSSNWNAPMARRINCLWTSSRGGSTARPARNASQRKSIQLIAERSRANMVLQSSVGQSSMNLWQERRTQRNSEGTLMNTDREMDEGYDARARKVNSERRREILG